MSSVLMAKGAVVQMGRSLACVLQSGVDKRSPAVGLHDCGLSRS